MASTQPTPTTTPSTMSRDVGIVPYLNVADANAAIEFYQRAFGAEELGRVPADDGKRLMHAALRINGSSVYVSDPFPEAGDPVQAPQGFSLHLQVDDADAWWNRAIDAGATIQLPIARQFWGDRFGIVEDPFGVRWSIGGPDR